MKLFVVRHGETDLNVRELACGVSEAKLTEKGRMQAQALANRLQEDKAKNNITTIYEGYGGIYRTSITAYGYS